jgi:hypothetical protein
MKYKINNFCGMSPLTVAAASESSHGPMVYVGAFAGSFHLSHPIRPAQAREMAAALIACADAQEAPINAEFAAHREMIGVTA